MTDTTNKYPYEIETPLDRRAMTIDILAGEVERKNKHIKYWKEKAYYHRDKCVEFQKANEDLQTDWNSVDAICDQKTFEIRALKERIGELENDSQMLGEELAELQTKKKEKTESKKKTNGKAAENKF